MSSYIKIAEPCHEDWNEMQRKDQGRHCPACCKTVVDFTDWNAPDIAVYLADPANRKTCGRFSAAQMNVSITVEKEEWLYRIYNSRLSGMKKIAAIIIIVFGLTQSACHNEPVIMGAIVPPKGIRMQDTVPAERAMPESLMGNIILMNDTTPPNFQLDPD